MKVFFFNSIREEATRLHKPRPTLMYPYLKYTFSIGWRFQNFAESRQYMGKYSNTKNQSEEVLSFHNLPKF